MDKKDFMSKIQDLGALIALILLIIDVINNR